VKTPKKNVDFSSKNWSNKSQWSPYLGQYCSDFDNSTTKMRAMTLRIDWYHYFSTTATFWPAIHFSPCFSKKSSKKSQKKSSKKLKFYINHHNSANNAPILIISPPNCAPRPDESTGTTIFRPLPPPAQLPDRQVDPPQRHHGRLLWHVGGRPQLHGGGLDLASAGQSGVKWRFLMGFSVFLTGFW
jgi:hypothetical protein